MLHRRQLPYRPHHGHSLYMLMASSSAGSSSSDALDDRYWSALASWLDVNRSALPSLQEEVQSQPLQFLSQNIPRLPEHLLRPQAALTTPQQRATIPLIRERRRRHAELTKPEEVDLRASRRRLGRLWNVMVGKQAGHGPEKGKTKADGELDPAFPGVPDLSSLPNVGASGSSLPRYGPPHQGELYTNPRLARLLDEQDEEEAQIRAAEQEEEEEEEEEGAVDDGETGDAAEVDQEDVETFRLAVLDRFVRGDVSSATGPRSYRPIAASGLKRNSFRFRMLQQPTLHPSVYAAIDFDESLDPASSHDDGAGIQAGLASDVVRGSAAQAALERERMDEDSYFDDEEES